MDKKRSVHDSIGPVKETPPWGDLAYLAGIAMAAAALVIALFMAVWTMLPS